MAKIKALLKSTQCWNFTGETSITGFNVEGTQPDESRRRFIFSVDEQLVKFNGNDLELFGQALNLQNVLQFGNTAEEIAAVTDIPAWLGKKVYPIIALECNENSNVMPTVKLSLNASSQNDIYAKDFYSPIMNFKLTGIRAKIKAAEINYTATGAATCLCYVRIKNNDVWEDWTTLDNVQNKYGMAAQFKVRCIVSTFSGDDSVTFSGAKITYTTDDILISGDTTQICSFPEDANYNLGSCRALIRHDKLQDTVITADAVYYENPKSRENVALGTGNGVLQILNLPDSLAHQDTLKIFADGVQVENFYYNTLTGEVQVNAPVGAEITASYKYGMIKTLTQPLTLESTYQDGEIFATRFICDELTNKKITAIIFTIKTARGNITENLGTATGSMQSFELEHRALKESLTCSGSWIYDEDTQILKVIQTAGENISVSYDYVGKSPVIFEYAAGWSAVQ